jgi:RNA polymerase sigma-70 factor (ECF subfamily)
VVTASRPHLRPVREQEDASLDALLAHVRGKDRRAIGAFFDRFEPEVNRLVWVLLGGDRDHDDLVQSAFEAMLRGVDQVRNSASVVGWVRQVTVNTVRMELRRRRLRRFFSLEDDECLNCPDLRVPDDAQRERTRALYRALSRLSVDERTMLVLRHLEGLELTEVAEAMSLSLSTLKRHASRAERRLAVLLGGSSS